MEAGEVEKEEGSEGERGPKQLEFVGSKILSLPSVLVGREGEGGKRVERRSLLGWERVANEGGQEEEGWKWRDEGERWSERGGQKEGSVKGEEGGMRGRTEAHGVEEGGKEARGREVEGGNGCVVED